MNVEPQRTRAAECDATPRRTEGGRLHAETGPTGAAARSNELRDGWSAILACFAMALFSWGFGFYGQAIYLADLHESRGWAVSELSLALTIYFVSGSLFLTCLHRAVRRFGMRSVLVGATLALGLGAVAVSRAETLWQVYAAEILMGVGWAGASSAAIAIALSERFERRRGLAVSAAMTGASAASFSVAPLLLFFTQRSGLAAAVATVAVPGLLCLVPLIAAAFSPRRRLAAPLRGPVRASDGRYSGPEASSALARPSHPFRDLCFWSVAAPFALGMCAQVGFLTHQVAFLQPRLGAATSVAIACSGIGAILGRVALGPFMDRLDVRKASALSFGAQGGALVLVSTLPDSAPALFAGVAVFGFNIGNVATFPALIIGREFGRDCFMRILGLSTAVGQCTYALGPLLVGLVRDLAGYPVALAACACLSFLAAIAICRWTGGTSAMA